MWRHLPQHPHQPCQSSHRSGITHSLPSQPEKTISFQETENQGQAGKALGGEGREGWWPEVFLPQPSGSQSSSRPWEHLPSGASTLGCALWAEGPSLFRPGRAGQSAWRLRGGLGVIGCCCPQMAQLGCSAPPPVRGYRPQLWRAQWDQRREGVSVLGDTLGGAPAAKFRRATLLPCPGS